MTHFAKLLKESKVVGSVDTKLEQVYTSYNGYLLNHRDFGLKRSLPNKSSPKSPWIRLKSIDTPHRHVDYRSASSETSLVQMWRQLEIGVKTARKNYGPTIVNHEPRPIRIEFSWFDEGSREASVSNSIHSPQSSATPSPKWLKSNPPKLERRRVKHIWQMHQSQFQDFLEIMRTRREDFKAFLERKESDRRQRVLSASEQADHEPEPLGSKIDLYQYAQGSPDQIRRDIEEFLEQISENEPIDRSNLEILPMPHPNLGLNYAHFDQLHNERLTPTIPGRVLDQADVKSSRQTVGLAGIVATLQRSSHIDLPSTSFEPDVNGYHNLDQGKAKFRVESAHIDPYDLPTEYEFQGFNHQPDQPVRYLDPRDKPRALGLNRLRVNVREAGRADSNRINVYTKIGSMEWVGNPPPKRQGTIVLDFLNSITRNLKPSSSPTTDSQARNPSKDPNTHSRGSTSSSSTQKSRLGQLENDQLLKVLKDLVGKPNPE